MKIIGKLSSPFYIKSCLFFMIVSPSILSADFSKLGDEIRKVVKAGADWIHIDVMDGHFVPNITIGPPVIKSIRSITSIPFDVHLMISDPEKHFMEFVKAGADYITVHAEASHSLWRLVEDIRKECKAGVSLNPATPLCSVEHLLDRIDLLLIMTVEPGFGGQKFITEMLEKIEGAKKMIDGRDVLLAVDGGVNAENIKFLREKGVDVVVAGSYIFKSKNYEEAIRKLKEE